MPRVCTICTHAEKPAINAALIANEPYRLIAERFGTSSAALTRHKADHLPASLAKAEAAKETALGDDLLAQVKQLRNKAISILLKAEAGGDYRTALMGIREARGCLELLAEMEGEISRQPVNILFAPEWQQARAVLVQALQPYPAARTAVAAALTVVEHGR